MSETVKAMNGSNGQDKRALVARLLREKANRPKYFPPSFGQQRLWLLHQLEPASALYNMIASVQLRGELDLGALRQAFTEITRRHESLRTTFAEINGELMQVVHPAKGFDLQLADLVAVPADQREAEKRRVVSESLQVPFDLAAGPLLRVSVLRLEEREHLLLLIMHHIVSDGWSLEVLAHEVGVLYHAFLKGLPAPLAELPIQYADFSRWQRERLSGEVLAEHLDYWRERLGGELPLLELPADRPRPAVRNLVGAACRIELPKALSEQLRAFSRGESVTLFMTLLAAFKTLLYRYTAQPDIIVGTPIAGRDRLETEAMIGFFVNTVAIRSDLSDNPSFREFVRRIKEVALGAQAHQELPFDMLVDELHVNRSFSQTPVFQVMFDLLNRTQEAGKKLEVQGWGALESAIHTAKFDLTLNMIETAECITGSIEYSTELFDETTIQRMLSHFKNLLQAICANPETRLDDLTLLSDTERHQQLFACNQTRYSDPALDLRLHQLFEQQVERTPDAIALVCEQEQLTYRELNTRANQLAHHLGSLGVGPESLVGVLMERSTEMVVSLLAIVKAGAAYVPLDPAYPQERRSFMLADAGIEILLTQSHLSETLASTAQGHSFKTIDLDLQWEAVTQEGAANPQVAVAADNAAYMIYTSGSTGRPKGVVNTHRGIVNRLVWMQQEYQLTEADRVLQKTPFSFDVSVWEFFWPLLTGARLVVARPGGHMDASYLARVIGEQGITTLHFVPSMLQVFLEERAIAECQSVRRVMSSGEALGVELEQRFFERLGWAELHNLYGPTEAAVDVSYWQCAAGSDRRSVPIGRPIANTQLYVLDKQLEPVAVGVLGEVYIGGVNLARGYKGRAELTAEKFVPHPFSERAGERLYRTGDVGKRLAGGEIEYVGRQDAQVKIRGFRIELGEIEAVLGEQDGVQEAVVVKQDGATDQRLVAYLLPDLERGAVLRRLLRHEADKLWPEESRYRLPNGMTVLHLNRGETNFLYQELFVEQSYFKHGIRLKAGACVFDVGANIGLFSLFVSEVCPQARLYCFEPLPPAFRVLETNAALYGPEAKLYECALSNRSGQQRFTYYPEASLMSGQHAAAAEEREVVKRYIRNGEQLSAGEELEEGMLEELLDDRLQTETYECRLRTLSEVIAEEKIEQIDLLKIDVEKSELEVLEGIEEGDWEKIKQIVVEVHDMDGRLAAVQSRLQRHGYQLRLEQDGKLRGTTLYNVYASREWAAEEEQAEGEQGEWRRWTSEAEMIAEVQQHLKEKLPAYMMPAAFVLVSEWPLTANGKLDKRALAEMKEGRRVDKKSYVAPRTPVEEIIAGIFSEVLSLERVSIFDNFFDLGGHSLLATLVVSRLREAFHVELPHRAVFDSPTIVDLSLAIAQRILEAERTDVAEWLGEVEEFSGALA